MIAQMQRYEIEFGKIPFFATYADRLSEKLYGSMGFKYLTRDMLDLVSKEDGNQVEIDDQGRVRILKNGVKWAPMYATQEMMSEILKSKLKKISGHITSADTNRSQQLYLHFLKAINQSGNIVSAVPEVFVGHAKNELSHQPMQVLLHVTHPTSDTAEIYIQRGDEHHKRFRETIRVPYPLPEGYGIGAGINGGHARVTYSNGVLKLLAFGSGSFLSQPSFGSQEIVIDSRLLYPQTATVISKVEGAFEDYLEIHF